jgi:PAS domain S-box-containing protein
MERAAKAELTAGPADLSEPVNILLVDDRPGNLQALQATLARPDYRLILAHSGPEALRLVLREEVALILLDVAMPGMDGFETARIVKQREQSRSIPIIFVTASVHDMQHVFRGYTVGAVDYLRKPLDPFAVRSKVAVFVELFRQRRRIERQATQLRAVELREQHWLRERAERALQLSEALYESTFERAPVGIGHTDLDGHWTRVNQRLCTIVGRARPQLIGMDLIEMLIPTERPLLARALADLLEGRHALYDVEHCLLGGGNGPVWARLTVSLLRDGSGSGAPSRLVVVANDVTERKAAEMERNRLVRQLEDGIRTRDDFISIAAHELKTPVTPLRLQTTWLLRLCRQGAIGREVPTDRLQRALEGIDRSSSRLESLVTTLLDVSRLSVGKVQLERQRVDLEELIEEVAARLAPEADRVGSRVEVSVTSAAAGQWDRDRLEQAATNLIGNAIKYGAGHDIDIEIGGDDQVGWFKVRDQGIGISAEAQARIFDRFERAAPLKHYGGFGLGLWISRQIVEAHGGHISVSSQPGIGSEFTVQLPVAPVPDLATRVQLATQKEDEHGLPP